MLEGVFQLLDGSKEKALQLGEKASAEQPRSVRASRVAALAAAALGDDARVLQHARGALSPREGVVDALTKREAAQFVEVVVQRTLAMAGKDEVLARGAKSLWDDLAAARSDDPLTTLAAARTDLQIDPRNPAVGAAQALGRLERFRKQHQKTCLDDLAPGATRAWTAFHAELDPGAALQFLLAERSLQPALADTWLDEPHVLELAGRHAEAAQAVRRADLLVPGARLARETLRLGKRGEMVPAAIEQAMLEIPAREGAAGPDPELVLMSAHAYSNLGTRYATRVRDLHSAVQPHLGVWKQLEAEWLLLGLRVAIAEGGDAAQASGDSVMRRYAEIRPPPADLRLARVLRGILRGGKPHS